MDAVARAGHGRGGGGATAMQAARGGEGRPDLRVALPSDLVPAGSGLRRWCEDGTAASLWRRSDLYLRERYEGRERERKEKGGRRSGALGVAPWNSGSHRRRSEAGQGSGARERCSGR